MDTQLLHLLDAMKLPSKKRFLFSPESCCIFSPSEKPVLVHISVTLLSKDHSLPVTQAL